VPAREKQGTKSNWPGRPQKAVSSFSAGVCSFVSTASNCSPRSSEKKIPRQGPAGFPRSCFRGVVLEKKSRWVFTIRSVRNLNINTHCPGPPCSRTAESTASTTISARKAVAASHGRCVFGNLRVVRAVCGGRGLWSKARTAHGWPKATRCRSARAGHFLDRTGGIARHGCTIHLLHKMFCAFNWQMEPPARQRTRTPFASRHHHSARPFLQHAQLLRS